MSFKDDLERVKALLREWDPIGVHPGEPGGAPMGEYDSYAGDVLRMLASGCTLEALGRHLALCRARGMGLPPRRAEDLASARTMVERWTGKGSADARSTLDVIASRTFDLRQEDSTLSPVVLRIGRPRRLDDRECRCEYEIDGLSQTRRFHASGEDEVQALWQALVLAGLDLRTSEEGKAGRITLWGGADLRLPSAEQPF